MVTAPVVTLSRLRMQTDGQGITTLAIFHGCPLRCRWCINPFSLDPGTKFRRVTAETLYEATKQDALYYLATGGGVTFGGGEPLLQADFLKEFRQLCGNEWHLCAETSLNVPWENVETAAGCIDEFIIDCKDLDPEIYRGYTGRDNALVMENLQKLLSLVGSERMLLRLPLIPEFNTESHRMNSLATLKAMGFTRFDLFAYKKVPSSSE